MTEKFQALQDLQMWDTNYDTGKGPWTLFLDLIGYSQEQFGSAQFDLTTSQLGYLELDYLADALKVYASVGEDAHNYVINTINKEATA
ncbi:MAG: hypothetical protein ACK5DE_03230 [Bacteroidota bacterium]|jgi:hypothetical protein